MNESNTLERFLDPQNFMYELALTEIRNGRKEEHWIWFIFPQLRGIGRSRMSYHYGIQDIAEAKSYYAHPILGKRLLEATQLILQQDKDLVEIFGHDREVRDLAAVDFVGTYGTDPPSELDSVETIHKISSF